MTIKSFYKPTPQLDAANLVINFQITNVRGGKFDFSVHDLKFLRVLKKIEFNKILSRSTPYSFLTTPFILSIAFALSVEFDFTTMAFEKPPVLSVLYLTLITPFWLGRIGSWGQDGTVQPQEENADVITRGSSPTFVNSNAHSPSEPLVIVS